MPLGGPPEPMLRRGMKAAGQLDTLPQLKKGLGSPALFGIVQGFIAASIYFVVGLVAQRALGFTWIVFLVGALLFPLVVLCYVEGASLIGAAFLVAVGYLLFLPLHLQTWEVFTNMAIAGIGSGALVGALPAAAAAAAPRGQTGVATALTNTTKTVGGSFASAVFGVVLLTGAATVTATAASLFGYLIVWTICGLGALVAAVLLFFVPRLAFADTEPALE